MTETTEQTGFADALVRLSHLVHYVFADVSRCYELTPQQMQLLCMLTRGPTGMAELGRLLHLEKSGLSGLVDRVERRGLVTRERESRDRRACTVALTSEGTRLAVESHQDVTARLEKLAGELRQTDKNRVMSAIVQILAAHGMLS